MNHDDALDAFGAIADSIGDALRSTTNWGPSGDRAGQYAVDLVADRLVLQALAGTGVSVLSEESGLTQGGVELVIVDPLDGSTNASRGIPWFATSLCLVDNDGAAVALVRNQASGVTFTAVRGGGAKCDGESLAPSSCSDVADAMVGLSGLPPRHLGWNQFRAYGASALDLCLVAAGAFDGFIDCSVDAHGVWDYAGAMLICHESGALVVDGLGRELLVRTPDRKRTPVAAATPELLAQLVSARRSF